MRDRGRRASFLALVGVVALLPLAAAQESVPTRGLTIGGVVRDDDTRHPISAVTLELHGNSGENAAPPVTSGTRGEFQFNAVGAGDYQILAHVQGYEPVSVAVMMGGVPLFNVTVAMRRVSDEH